MAIKYLEFYFLSVIKGQKRGIIASLLRFILLLLSCPFRVGVACRNWLFDHGWFRSYIPPVPLVISIGNITAGGTGKTPVTLLIGEAFHNKVNLAILSRGYRSLAEKSSVPILLHRSRGISHPASICGDEPYLLSEHLPEAQVIVGRDRYQSSKMAARLGAEVLLLDDGMQHRGIARDLEVVVMDLYDPFGQGYFFPRGLLREGKKALARADLIVLNHAHARESFEKTKRQISHTTSAPVVGTQLMVEGVFSLRADEIKILPGMKVGIFCGIAHPEYFRSTVVGLGAVIVDELFFPDHDALDLELLLPFAELCKSKGAEILLCTEKDRVKISDPGDFKLPVGWVKTRLEVTDGKEHWSAFMDRAKTILKIKG